MSTNLSVIFAGRHHFGNQAGFFRSVASEVEFVGPTSSYGFVCGNIVDETPGILAFRAFDVAYAHNVIRLNGVDLEGALTPTRTVSWQSGFVVVPPGTLVNGENELLIEARSSTGRGGGAVDDFLLETVTLLYQMRHRNPRDHIVPALPTPTSQRTTRH